MNIDSTMLEPCDELFSREILPVGVLWSVSCVSNPPYPVMSHLNHRSDRPDHPHEVMTGLSGSSRVTLAPAGVPHRRQKLE